MGSSIFRIALRNVLRRRRRSLLTLGAIGLSIACLLCVRGTLNALQTLLLERVVLGSAGVIQVHKKGFADNLSATALGFAIEDVQALAERIEKIPGVVAVAPRLDFLTMVSAGDRMLYAPAVGVDPERELLACPRRDAEWGAARVGADAGIVSPEIARQIDGKQITLLAADADGVLNAIDLALAGVLGDNPAFSSEKKIVYLPLAAAQRLLRMPGQALSVVVRGADLEQPEPLAAALETALGPRFEVRTWKQNASFAADMLRAQDSALRWVTGVFVCVLLIGIVNAMLMNVLARTREIGTMMALGMTRQKILALFIAESTLLGGIGAFFGIGLGLLAVSIMHRFGIVVRSPGGLDADILRPLLSARFVLITAVVALGGGACAAVYPAWRACQMTPSDALAAR